MKIRIAFLVCWSVIIAISIITQAYGAESGTSLHQLLSAGKVDLSIRWRFENVEDDLLRNGRRLKDANASTVRATLGYKTPAYNGFSAYLQFESIGAVGIDDYYDGSGTGNARFATVVDPEGTEINQGYVSWQPQENLELKAGRQIITYRGAPFHRFIGTVLWRQNWQTFDAFSGAFKPSKNLQLNYAYIWNVNRIFGEDAPEPLSDFDSASHLINAQYTGIPNLRLEAYAYLLDFDNAERFSSNTYGLRANGSYPINEHWALIYTGEFAHQADASGNPFDYDEEYFLAEGGVKINIASIIKSLTLKFSYEILGGSGKVNGAFVTILGTNHAFQGWSDRFLVTPNNGITDRYFTAVMPLDYSMKLVASYHDLDSDEGDFDYGENIDLMLTKSFLKHYQAGIKASFYDADNNARNNSGGPSADATKIWVWLGFKL